MELCEPKALVGVHFIRWIATYPLDKVIRSLNNWGHFPVWLSPRPSQSIPFSDVTEANGQPRRDERQRDAWQLGKMSSKPSENLLVMFVFTESLYFQGFPSGSLLAGAPFLLFGAGSTNQPITNQLINLKGKGDSVGGNCPV